MLDRYVQVGFVIAGLERVPKKRADGPSYCASAPNELPLVICPNSQTHCPPTDA